jgi:hypothetical protein
MIFGVGLAALGTAKTAQAIAVLSELYALTIAGSAIHEYKIQQSLAVCQGESNNNMPFIFNTLRIYASVT